jgi:hypothetical protein
MNYVLNLFSPETWQAFRENGCSVTGFSRHQRTQAEQNIRRGDNFVCYLVRLSRWCGVLEVQSEAYVDDTPIFQPDNDPFIVRFHVKPLVVLDAEFSIPVALPEIWNQLNWTKEISPGSVGWAGNFQKSLRIMPPEDGEFLRDKLSQQETNKSPYPLSERDQRNLRRKATVRTLKGQVPVEIPDEALEENDVETEPASEERPAVRESVQVQALLATIGATMRYRVWIPRNDRSSVAEEMPQEWHSTILEQLPLNYDDATIRTIREYRRDMAQGPVYFSRF